MTETMPVDINDRAAIVAAITSALTGVLGRGAVEVDENTRLFEDLGLDSTTVLELLMQIEDETGLQLEVDGVKMSDFQTVGTLASFVVTQAA